MQTTTVLLVALIAFPTISLPQTGGRVFPERDSITGAPPLSDFDLQWYSKHLIAMGEPLLPDGPGEVYRFLWLRSFHEPIMTRITCDPQGCHLVGIRLDGNGGYEPGEVTERKERRLSDQETTRFRRLLNNVQFWREQPMPRDGLVHLDGAQWIIEGRREGRYHIWNVWSPRPTGLYADFRELCLELLRLSGLTIESSDIY